MNETDRPFLDLMMLLVIFSPLASNDVRASEHAPSTMTTFSFKGVASEAYVVGEWNGVTISQ